MLTQSELKRYLHYDPETGIFTNLIARHYKTVVGAEAGAIHSTGYRIIKINGCAYPAHRLAFLYMEGSFPDEDTDHQNLDRADNRWENIRRAETAENCQNRPIFCNNKSGCAGVFLRSENGKYRVYVNAFGKRYAGGDHATFEAAVIARNTLAAKLHVEFGRLH